MAKFTFKTTKPTGRYRSFENSWHDIKLDKKVVGCIVDKTWKIRLTVWKDSEFNNDSPNVDWVWITLKKESASLDEAKAFLNDNIDIILKKYNLRKDGE